MLTLFKFGLLVFVPLAVLARVLAWPPVLIFACSALAIVPLAGWLSSATEALAARSGSGVGALLNATFGNATELIIALVAVRAGLDEVVKASLAGSIIGNILLVLGLALVVGGARRERQVFNRTASGVSATAMLLAVLGLVTPTAFGIALGGAPDAELERSLSRIVGALLILGYLLHLLFSLKTHAHLYAAEAGADLGPGWPVGQAVLILAAATAAIAVMSEILVGSIEGVTHQLGWSEGFIGVILIPIVGNAAEHVSAVTVAAKNKLDLSLGIALGSSMQVALLVAPLLVFLSIPLGHPMDLRFVPLELFAIGAAVAIANLVTLDGESNWFEGALLLIAYAVTASAFFLLP